MDKYIIAIILTFVMAIVTYIIRMIPFVFFRKKIKSNFIKSLLYYIPYAVLSAMTFPAIFYSTGSSAESIIMASVGTVIALIASITKRSLVVVAILAIVAVLATYGIMLLV
ncbi:MAG: AzlD domain-containing protein [Clostridia bacterium]|nr:AzlD domain-containing protein [Clostridia bacterium]